VFLAVEAENRCHKLADMLPPKMPPHSLATASGLLLGTTGAAMLAGALLGWAFGSWGIGLLIGALVGIPLSVLVVYKVYTSSGSQSA
jgi:hypothetical protein